VSVRGAAVLALAVCALGGCAGSSGAPQSRADGAVPRGDAEDGRADGGDDGDGAAAEVADAERPFDAVTWEVLPPGWRAFDVTAAITVTPPADQAAAWADFPKSARFSFAWDPASARALAGTTAAAPVATNDGRIFQTTDVLSIEVPFASSCGGLATLALGTLTFSVDASGALRGTARGSASYRVSDFVAQADASFSLEGAPDITAPSLALPSATVDPMAPLRFAASEPLMDGAVASLVGSRTGDVVALGPVFVSVNLGIDRLISAFAAPNVTLRAQETYTVEVTGATDLAGNPLVLPAAPVFLTAPRFPLVPNDGFESVTGTMFAGAGVLNGGPLMPIEGRTSLLLNTGFGGGFGFLPYDLGPSLAVRLAVTPGTTLVRFDAQLIAPDPIDQAAFDGVIRAGPEGGPASTSMGVSATGFVKETLPTLGDVFVSPVEPIEMPVSPNGAAEILFEIKGVTFSCSLPPPPTVLVVDNLRVE
jgi:hypothetical protein